MTSYGKKKKKSGAAQSVDMFLNNIRKVYRQSLLERRNLSNKETIIYMKNYMWLVR